MTGRAQMFSKAFFCYANYLIQKRKKLRYANEQQMHVIKNINKVFFIEIVKEVLNCFINKFWTSWNISAKVGIFHYVYAQVLLGSGNHQNLAIYVFEGKRTQRFIHLLFSR